MKDTPKQILNDLITFIYCGQVKIKQENLDDFLIIAKQLKIKGLTDDNFSLQSFGSHQPSAPINNIINNRSQFNSIQTTRIHNNQLTNSKFMESNDYRQPSFHSQSQQYFEQESSNEGGHDNNNSNYDDDDFGIDNIPMDQKYNTRNVQWDYEYYDNQSDGGDEKPAEANVPKTKRAKPSSNGE